MKWIIRGYAVILLTYTGWRTYDFMVHQLPTGDASGWIAILFLFATEAGLALWHEISLNHSTTHEQQYLSTALTWLDLVGSLAAGVADMILRQTLAVNYTIPPMLISLLVYGLPLAVALNVAGVLFYLSNDGEQQITRAKAQLKFEITRAALQELRENRGAIAESMKRTIYGELRDDVTGKLERQYLKEHKQLPQVKISSNGHLPQVYNAEVDADPLLVKQENRKWLRDRK